MKLPKLTYSGKKEAKQKGTSDSFEVEQYVDKDTQGNNQYIDVLTTHSIIIFYVGITKTPLLGGLDGQSQSWHTGRNQ